MCFFELRLYILFQENTPLAGSSAGALVSAVIASGLTMDDAMLATKELAADCRKNGTAFRLGVLMFFFVSFFCLHTFKM